MKKTNKIKKLASRIIPILKKNGVVKAGIFGSYARGDERKKSDVDILIEFGAPKSLLDLVHVQLELEEKISKKFDVLTYKSVHPYIKNYIMQDEVRIL